MPIYREGYVEIRRDVYEDLLEIQGLINQAIFNASQSEELTTKEMASRSYYHNDYIQHLIAIKNQTETAMSELLKFNGKKKEEEPVDLMPVLEKKFEEEAFDNREPVEVSNG